MLALMTPAKKQAHLRMGAAFAVIIIFMVGWAYLPDILEFVFEDLPTAKVTAYQRFPERGLLGRMNGVFGRDSTGGVARNRKRRSMGWGFVGGDTKIGGRASGLDRPSASTAFAEVEMACQRGSKAGAAPATNPTEPSAAACGSKAPLRRWLAWTSLRIDGRSRAPVPTRPAC